MSIYFIDFTELSTELYSWLFEMDIVKNSRTVKMVLENNGLVEPENQGANNRDRRTTGVLSDYLWPNGRIPYVFDSILSEFSKYQLPPHFEPISYSYRIFFSSIEHYSV